MKSIITIFLAAMFAFSAQPASAQSSARGFDYQSHQHLNKRAKHWGKRRVKAADGDQTNIKCSVRKSRRAARRARG